MRSVVETMGHYWNGLLCFSGEDCCSLLRRVFTCLLFCFSILCFSFMFISLLLCCAACGVRGGEKDFVIRIVCRFVFVVRQSLVLLLQPFDIKARPLLVFYLYSSLISSVSALFFSSSVFTYSFYVVGFSLLIALGWLFACIAF